MRNADEEEAYQLNLLVVKLKHRIVGCSGPTSLLRLTLCGEARHDLELG